MSIDVSGALKNEGVSLPFSEAIDLGTVSYPQGDFVTVGETRVKGSLTAMEKEIFVQGDFRVTLRRVCDRCAEEYERSYDLAFQETFTALKEDNSPEDYIYTKDQLSLERMLEDCVVLELPSQSLCRDDCKGLCPMCGVNLNLAQCSCGATNKIGPFGVLAGFVDRD